MVEKSVPAYYTLLLIFFSSLTYLSHIVERSQSIELILTYFAAFFSYFWLSKFEFDRFTSLFILGITVRLSLFFSLPDLSDDFYRFLWDGTLINNGINPYLSKPSDLLPGTIEGLNQKLYEGLNSKHYYTIYPPLNQGIFWLSTTIGDSLLSSVNVIRAFLLAAEIGSFLLLRSLMGDKKQMVFWYFLNPLVILEITGNIHFEGFVVFFVLLTLFFIKKSQIVRSAAALGLAAATKLLPLIFIPLISWKYRWKKGFMFFFIAISIVCLSFIPFIEPEFGLISSFSLYFQKFEFNASIYYLLRQVGFLYYGYNIIETLGPRLAMVSVFLILFLAIYLNYYKRPVSEGLLFTLTVYLLLTTTIHPWYILLLIPLGLLSGYFYPVVWSFMIFMTYIGYGNEPYQLPMLFVILEYLIVFLILTYEIWKNATNFHDNHLTHGT